MKVKKLKNALLVGTLLLASIASQAQNWQLNGNLGTNPSNDWVGTLDNADLAFRTMNVEWMRLTQNGFLGVGTSAPNYHLDVNGDINFSSGYAIKVAGTNLIKPVTSNVFINSTSSITTGTYNYMFGLGSGSNTTNGNYNTFLGYQSGLQNISGNKNNYLGYQAGYTIQGNDNNIIGTRAGYLASGGNENNFIGNNAGYNNTIGELNTFIGSSAGWSNQSGTSNIFAGQNSGFNNTSGNYNLFLGNNSGHNNSSGSFNTFLGVSSGNHFGPFSDYNIAIGYEAGGSGVPNPFSYSQLNTVIGAYSGSSLQYGYDNLCLGTASGQSLTNGNYNMAIGGSSTIQDGYYNIVIGLSSASVGGLINSTAIGAYSLVASNNTMALGGTGDNAMDVLIGYSSTSGYQLDVNGTTRNLSGTWVTSDNRFKKNVTTLNGALGSIMKLNPVKYQYKDNIVTINEKGDTTKFNFSKGDQIGFLAQELEQVIPELVNTDNNGYKAVNYAQMVSVLVQGIKEQQVQIEKQNIKIEELTKQIAGSNNNNNNGNNTSSNKLDQSSLSQNTPNPFSETTIIKYHLNNGAQSSTILIFDLNGTLLKTYNLNVDNKDGEIQINSGELKPGMFIYSLVVNNNEVDTKKMILSK